MEITSRRWRYCSLPQSIALLPSILVMMTSFTRIHHFLLPFLRTCDRDSSRTRPIWCSIGHCAVFNTVHHESGFNVRYRQNAYEPYRQQADHAGAGDCNARRVPLKRVHAAGQTEQSSLNMFCDLAQAGCACVRGRRPMALSHAGGRSLLYDERAQAMRLRSASYLYIPFMLIDVIVVSSTLMSMGMIMLPPGDDLHAVQAAVVCHGGWMATVVFHAGAGLPIAVEKGGCHSGSKSGDGYSAGRGCGVARRDWRANADC